MISFNGKEISSIYINDKLIAEVYKNSALLWQSIRSCFGKGFWINDKPWDNKDGWKN